MATVTGTSGILVDPGRQALPARVLGIVVSPRATYAGVAAHPRVLGALLVVIVVISAVTGLFLSTDVGQDALLEQQLRVMESFGAQVSDQMYEGMASVMRYAPYFAAGNQLVFVPAAALVISGLLIAVFNAFMGGNATFKQVYAVVVHSGLILALQAIFSQPLNYAREAMSSPTTLAAFTPFLDESTFPARLLGAIDLFLIWWIISLAIGIGVLYRKRTTPIATTMIGVYVVVAVVVAAIMTSLSGV